MRFGRPGVAVAARQPQQAAAAGPAGSRRARGAAGAPAPQLLPALDRLRDGRRRRRRDGGAVTMATSVKIYRCIPIMLPATVALLLLCTPRCSVYQTVNALNHDSKPE